MSRPAVVATCVAVLIAGWIGGRVTGGSRATEVIRETVEHTVVVSARYLGSARDPHDTGPLDLARVESARRGSVLQTTIAAYNAWRDSLLRGGNVRLSIIYDVDNDGKPDRRDIISLFRGRLMSWISSFGQGVQSAKLTRHGPTTISVARDATLFYSAPGKGALLTSSPIGVAVVARWKGGGDRVPNRGWIIVAPPIEAGHR